MRKQFMIFLTAMLFVFSLTACGSDQKPDSQNNTNQNSSDSTTTDDSATGGSQTGGTANSGASTGSSGNGSGTNSMLSGDNATTGTNDAVGDTLFGGNETQNATANSSAARTMGTGYEQMLRNARVHDTDGDLSDLENDYTPGSLGW